MNVPTNLYACTLKKQNNINKIRFQASLSNLLLCE